MVIRDPYWNEKENSCEKHGESLQSVNGVTLCMSCMRTKNGPDPHILVHLTPEEVAACRDRRDPMLEQIGIPAGANWLLDHDNPIESLLRIPSL